MLNWLHGRYFSNLELESQKNRLLLFMLVPTGLLGEINIIQNIPFQDSINLHFASYYALLFAVCACCVNVPRLQPAFKYIVMSGMLLFTMYELWLFNDYSIIYQIVYINMALALIYLDGMLIMFTGLATAAFTALGFMFWHELFFPGIPLDLANVPVIFVLQTTVVLWGVTVIGARKKRLIQQNEEQLRLIKEQNESLAQYAKQVERLTTLEERSRMARELHDTMGHTLTTVIAGLELVKHAGTSDGRIDSLLQTASKGLNELRDQVHGSDMSAAGEPLPDAVRELAEQIGRSAGMETQLLVEGIPYALPTDHTLHMLRCVQESITNAVRHGKATRLRIHLRYDSAGLTLTVEDNGTAAGELELGYGLRSMQARLESMRGSLRVTQGLDRGTTVECRIPAVWLSPGTDIKLLIAEDKPLIAESFAVLLGMEPDIEIAGIARTGEEAAAMCESLQPDVILMDIHMPVLNGIEAARLIKERNPAVKIIALTTFQEIRNAAEIIRAGADGYLNKSIQPKLLADSIRLVHAGGTLVSAETARLLMESSEQLSEEPARRMPEGGPDAQVEAMSDKELEILGYLAQGLKNKEIAEIMHYTEGTVKNYLSVIYAKLCVDNRIQALKKAQEWLGAR